MAESEWEDVPTMETDKEGNVWEDVPQDVPTAFVEDKYKHSVMKPQTETFFSYEGKVVPPRLESIVNLMKTESIPAHLISWLTTPEETYRKKERIEKSEFIKSIPLLSQMNNRLDEIEWNVGQGDMSPTQEDEHNKLIDAYGTMYQKMEKAYDAGDLEGGFSWEGFKEALSDDPSGMLAELANTFMADPELLMTPIGWEYSASKAVLAVKSLGASEKVANIAKVTGGLSGVSALGSGLAAADNVSRQLGEKGEVNMSQVGDAATIGAIAAPILVGGFKASGKGLKGASAANFNRQFKKSIKKVESGAQEFMAKGLANPEQAIHRAINNSFIPNKVRKSMAQRHDWMRDVNLSEEAVALKRTKIAEDSKKIKTKIYKGLSEGSEFVSNLLGNLSTEVGLIHGGLRHAIKRLDMDTAISMKVGLDVKDSFGLVFKGLSKSDRVDLNIALGNGHKKGVADILDRSTASGESKATIQKSIDSYFDDVYNRSEVAGMGLKKIDNYFPMEVKDYKAFARHMGFEPRYVDELLGTTINKKFKLDGENKVKSHVTMKEASEYLSSDEISQVLNKALRTPYKATGKGAKHAKKRVIENYNRDNIQFYRDPVESFANYVTSMEPKIQETMFFGGKKGATSTHSGFISDSIGSTVKRLYDSGEIIADDLNRLEELFTARFIEGTRAPHKVISGAKNVLYTATLGNPLSAMTQMGDLGNSAYVTSIMDTVTAVPKVMAGKGVFKMEDFGLNNIVQEFEHLGTSARVLDKSLQWSGFKAIDRLGKETVLNATLSKYSRMSKSKVGRGKLIDKYKEAFTPAQMSKVIDDLSKGNHTPDVKYLLWHELTRIQPVSLSEMPVSYIRNPNARMFYMLKTFTLKQLDLVRREAYHKIRSGDYVGGMGNLARWTGILGLSNTSVEHAKAWVRGEDVEFSDMFIAQMYRNYGLSQYIMDQVGQGRPVVAITALAMPPVAIVDDAVQDLVNFGERFESLKYVPPFGKGLYYLLDMDEDK